MISVCKKLLILFLIVTFSFGCAKESSDTRDDLVLLQKYGLTHLTTARNFSSFLQKNGLRWKDPAAFDFLQQKAKKYVRHLGAPKVFPKKANSLSDLDVSVISKKTFYLWDRYKISIASNFKHKINLYVTIPKSRDSGSKSVMICLHQSVYTGKDEPMGLTESTNDYARFFADKGYITITPDILGFGEELKTYTTEKPIRDASNYNLLTWNEPYRQILKDNPDWTGIGIYIYELRRVVDFIYYQNMFKFDKEKVMVTGLSQGALIPGFVLPFEKRIKVYTSVGGGYAVDLNKKSEQKAWSQPIYFGSRLTSFLSAGKWNLDYWETLCLIFPRKMILFNAEKDRSGRISDKQIKTIADLYSSFNIRRKFKAIMEYPLEHGRSPHRYDREVQDIIVSEIEK